MLEMSHGKIDRDRSVARVYRMEGMQGFLKTVSNCLLHVTATPVGREMRRPPLDKKNTHHQKIIPPSSLQQRAGGGRSGNSGYIRTYVRVSG